MSSFLPGVPIPDVILFQWLEKWEGSEEGKKLRTSLFCELYLEFLYLIGIIFFFQMQNFTECGKKGRKKSLTPIQSKSPRTHWKGEETSQHFLSSDMCCFLRSWATGSTYSSLRFQAPIRGLWVSHRGLLRADERTAPLPPSSLAHPTISSWLLDICTLLRSFQFSSVYYIYIYTHQQKN